MLRIHLEARHPSLNLARVYSIDLTQDLFGDWILKTTYGRIGSGGQTKCYAFKTAEAALPKVKSILSKRASAPRRLACHYQLIDFYQDSSLSPLNILEILQKPSSSTLNVSSKSKKTVFLPLFDI